MKNSKYVLVFVLLSALTASAYAQNTVSLGNIKRVAATFQKEAETAATGKAKTQVRQLLPNNKSLVLILNLARQEGDASLFFGEVYNTPNSNFYLRLSGSKATGSIIMKKQKKYYEYSSDLNGLVYLTEKDIDKVLCIGVPEKKKAAAAPFRQTGAVAGAPPSLQSLPGAKAVLYLDFDGQTVTNTLWNTSFNHGNPIVADPADLTQSEMVEIWKMVSEDYRPFGLNVTTSEAVFNTAPFTNRMRVIFTPTNYFFPNAGGVAYVGSFTYGNTIYGETPCWVWNTTSKYAGEAGSHESGHTMGLSHDGRTSPQKEYFEGQNSWAPIMGVGYYKPLVQWSKGEYLNANNHEDDLAIISSENGFGYRGDDHGNSVSSATSLIINDNGKVSPADNKGIITTPEDADVFSFATSGGKTTLTVNPDPDYPDLDVYLTLRSADNTVVATADPSAQAAALNVTLKAGNYYLTIDGVKGSLGANSDYGSLGAYSISGNIPTGASTSNKPPVVSITSPANNARYTAPATITINATASDSDGTVSSVKFYNGSTYLKTDFTSPYSYTLSNLSAGTYSITAKATDNSGAETVSAAVKVIVTANNAPVVSITSPTNNSSFAEPATITIEAAASETDGTIYSVKFYNGTTYLKTDFTSPYSYTLSDLPAGTYSFTAKATDNNGVQTTSAPVTVKVTNAVIASSKPYSQTDKTALNDALSLRLSPNPASNILNIFTSRLQQNKPTTLSIISVSGIVLKTMHISNAVTQVDISQLVSGVYTIKIISGEKVVYKQFVKL